MHMWAELKEVNTKERTKKRTAKGLEVEQLDCCMHYTVAHSSIIPDGRVFNKWTDNEPLTPGEFSYQSILDHNYKTDYPMWLYLLGLRALLN